jgi:CubicO group peptidase (beta-lactamase class C family)
MTNPLSTVQSMSSSPDFTVHGLCAPDFDAVQAAFEHNHRSGSEVGSAVAVTVNGQLVVDLWAGHMTTDHAPRTGWDRDTIITTWSVTKSMVALCCHLLADRGLLDLHAPIAHYWPEFAAAGKGSVTTAHVLSHASGVSGFEHPVVAADMWDWDKMVSLLAAQPPWWEPGTQSGYHILTQGYLLGEVIRRITGVTVGQFFAAEIAGPLDADFHIGTSAANDERIAHVVAAEAEIDIPEGAANTIAARSAAYPRRSALIANTAQWRRAEVPSSNGHGNARSIARIHSMVANGGEVDGIRVLSEAACQRIFEEQTYGTDLVLGRVIRQGLGFGLISPEMPLSPNARSCYWFGRGGSLGFIDCDAQMSFGYVVNRMEDNTMDDTRAVSALAAVYQSLGVPR